MMPTHCLKLDRRKPDGAKIISDAEIAVLKYNKQISARLAQVKRKKAFSRVLRIIILDRFIQFIKSKAKGGEEHIHFTFRVCKSLERRYPLRVKDLGWENWMWEYFLDEKTWAEFSSGLAQEYRQLLPYNLLHIKLSAYEHICSIFTGVKKK